MFKFLKKLFAKKAEPINDFEAFMKEWDEKSYEQQMSYFPESWKQYYPKKG